MGMHPFRAHQKELNNWFDKHVKDGALDTDKVTLNITPGGGKSTLPSIMAMHLIPQGIVDLIVWVTPRQNLSRQAADGFEVERGTFYDNVRGERFHCPYKARWRQNRAPILSEAEVLKENVRCYTTTYSAIIAAKGKPGLHSWMFENYKVALVLDECHHLVDDSNGQQSGDAIRPLMDKAVFTMVMTGTPDRKDGRQILGLDYMPGKDPASGKHKLERCNVVYSRNDAIGEGAKLPINFQVLDGAFSFKEDEDDGDAKEGDEIVLSTADDIQRRQVFKHGMNTDSDYVREAINRTCRDFLENRRVTGYHHSQLIVVLSLQDHADYWQRYIQQEFKLKTALAVSKNAESCAQILRFRDGAYDALVTVGMAYEGLDAPATTHMCVLRNIRSEPFLEQCFDRATRIDYGSPVPKDSQCAHIYVPSDESLQKIIARLQAAQAQGIQELYKRSKEQDIKELNNELPEGVERVLPISPAVAALLKGDGTATEQSIAEAKAQLTDSSPLDQVLAVLEAEKKFLATQIKEVRERGTHDSADGWDETTTTEITIVVDSRVTDQRVATLLHPVLNDQKILTLKAVLQEFPELRWAPVDRVLKQVENGQLVLKLN